MSNYSADDLIDNCVKERLLKLWEVADAVSALVRSCISYGGELDAAYLVDKARSAMAAFERIATTAAARHEEKRALVAAQTLA